MEVLQLAQVILTTRERLDARFTIPSSVLVLVTVALLTALSPLDHSYSFRPSSLIQAYLFLTLLLDIPRLRTAWLIYNYTSSISNGAIIVQTLAFATKGVLLWVESLSKGSRIIQREEESLSAEDKAGFFSRSLLLWMNPLLWKGYQRKITMDDLDAVGKDLEASKLIAAVEIPFRRYAGMHRRLAISLLSAFLKQLAIIQFPRLALVGFAIAQPYLILSSLNFVQDPTAPMQFGYGLIGAYALTYIGIAVSSGSLKTQF